MAAYANLKNKHMTGKKFNKLVERLIKLQQKRRRSTSELYELAMLQTITNLMDESHSEGDVILALTKISDILK